MFLLLLNINLYLFLISVKSLEHLNETMSDSDSDVPELVPSSDEEEVKPIKTNGKLLF